MPWKAVSQSVVGTLHQQRQIPCQDYGNWHLLQDGEIVLGAIADGAGSARYAEVGALSAVTVVLEYWSEHINEFVPVDNTAESIPTEADIQAPCHRLLQQVRQKLELKAVELDCPLGELACTLVAFLATPQWTIALQVGDSFLVVRGQEDLDYQLVFYPDRGELANETTFVTTQADELTMQCKVLSKRLKFICAATDGLESVAIHRQDWQPYPPFFEPLENFLTVANNLSQEELYLKNFLSSERLNARTSDDKTLLLCLYCSNE